ncbi:hypothetical protein ACQPU1_11805 [Clostridium paraputrificum]|uniref:hypothetical protein n=1 Tax=Clostridium paraputrificum TaxID=29363 RepID=UPI003D336766
MKKKGIFIILAIIVILIPIGIVSLIYSKDNTEDENKGTNITAIEFNDYFETFKEETQEYIIGDAEEELKDIVSKSSEAIQSNNTEAFPLLKVEIEAFKEKVTTINKENLNKIIEEVKALDISTLSEEKKKEIQVDIDKAEGYIKNNYFKSANIILESFVDRIKSEIGMVTYKDINGSYLIEYKNKVGTLVGQSIVVVNIINEEEMEIINASGNVTEGFYIGEDNRKVDFDYYTEEDIKNHGMIKADYQFGIFKKSEDNIWEGSINPYVLITNLANRNQVNNGKSIFNNKKTYKAKIVIQERKLIITYDNGRSYTMEKVSDSLNADDILKIKP